MQAGFGFLGGFLRQKNMLGYMALGQTGYIDGLFICNGALAGLVAITAPCAYATPWATAVIGLLSGLIMKGVVWLVEVKMKVDDPLGAVAIHAANGIWRMLAIGIFADGTYGGGCCYIL